MNFRGRDLSGMFDNEIGFGIGVKIFIEGLVFLLSKRVICERM